MTTITTTGGAAVEGVRIADMPDLGAVSDTSSVVGERAGSGRFNAIALRAYVLSELQNLPTSPTGLPTGSVWLNGGFLCVVP